MDILKYVTRPLFSAFLFCGLFFPPPAQAEDAAALQLYEQKIKAGLIYNFLKYTEWPPEKMSKDTPSVVICILGAHDPFNGYLEPIEERTVNQHPIRLRHVFGTEDTAACHLLFISEIEREHWSQLRRALADKNILTVGDFDGFANDGGMIQFGNKDNHIYVELNVNAISSAHLTIYNNLRRLARTSQPPSPGP